MAWDDGTHREERALITFHASTDGGHDYLDLHEPDGSRFYLDRDEARRLAADILRRAANDIMCPECARLNGVHQLDCPVNSRRDEAPDVMLWGGS